MMKKTGLFLIPLLALILLLQTAVAQSTPTASANLSDFDQPSISDGPGLPSIILLPGTMGTRLANTPDVGQPGCDDRPGGEIWPNLFGIFSPDYSQRFRTLWLDESGTTPFNACDQINPTSVIIELQTGIGSSIDYYGAFIDAMQDDGYDVYPFPYDWRLDLEQVAQNLDDFIDQTVGGGPVILVGHSLGGLVARQFTLNNARAQQVDQVISVGTPYWGAPAVALYMRQGTLPVETLNDLLSVEDVRPAHRNSPSIMQLLPSEAYVDQLAPYYVDRAQLLTSQAATRDFFVAGGQNEYLLDLAATRHAAIDDFRDNLTLPYYVLTANNGYTLQTTREMGCWREPFTCWDELSYVVGDGTVPWVSARLSGAEGDWSGTAVTCTFTSGQLSTGHSQLMVDAVVIADIRRILQGEPMVDCQLPAANLSTEDPLPLQQLTVRGGAEVDVVDSSGRFAGINNLGIIVNEIPQANYRTGEQAITVVLQAGDSYTITLRQTGPIPLDLRLSHFTTDSLETLYLPRERVTFLDLPTFSGGQAHLLLTPTTDLAGLELLLDLNNDGQIDEVVPPTAVLDEAASQELSLPATGIGVEAMDDEYLVTITAAAGEAGLYKTEYSLDSGQSWQPYSSPFSLTLDQATTIQARSMDLAGNQEAPWPVRFLLPYQLYLPLVIGS
jgi:pimeloyl-ACP methyl ester carboxylesterase